MLRKTILAGATGLAVGAAALAPTSASAWWGGHPGWHPGYHGWHHGGFYRPAVRVYAGPVYGSGCLARRVVWTPYGPVLRLINVCRWG
jgi:hypothetical protein